jgi:hypothetical protein
MSRPIGVNKQDEEAAIGMDKCLAALRGGVRLRGALRTYGLLAYYQSCNTALANWFRMQVDQCCDTLSSKAQRTLHRLLDAEDPEVVARVAIHLDQAYINDEQFREKLGRMDTTATEIGKLNEIVLALLTNRSNNTRGLTRLALSGSDIVDVSLIEEAVVVAEPIRVAKEPPSVNSFLVEQDAEHGSDLDEDFVF